MPITPSEFLQRASGYKGISVKPVAVLGKDQFHVTRSHGDLLLEAVVLDIPVHMPVSAVISLCRDLDLPVSEFGITLHDM